MPSRRAYLTTLAATGIAGCIGDSSGSATESPSDTATTAPGTAPRPDVNLEAAAVQYSYRHIENVDWNGVRPADGQFVFVTVDARSAETTPSRSAFSLAADADTSDAVKIERRYPVNLDVPGEPYMVDTEDTAARGWLVFDVPAQLDSAPSLRLEQDSGSWEWDLDTEKATAPPPEWEYDVQAPDSVAPGTTFDITITAENVGDGPGTFRGAVNFSYPMYRPKGFAVTLEAGESGSDAVSAEVQEGASERDIDYGVRTPTEATTVTVAVESGETATESSN